MAACLVNESQGVEDKITDAPQCQYCLRRKCAGCGWMLSRLDRLPLPLQVATSFSKPLWQTKQLSSQIYIPSLFAIGFDATSLLGLRGEVMEGAVACCLLHGIMLCTISW